MMGLGNGRADSRPEAKGDGRRLAPFITPNLWLGGGSCPPASWNFIVVMAGALRCSCARLDCGSGFYLFWSQSTDSNGAQQLDILCCSVRLLCLLGCL